MRNPTLALMVLALVGLGACGEDPELDTSRDTAGDPLGGLTALDAVLYATNHDESGQAGSQVSLFPFPLIGIPELTEVPLDLNGCGYLAMTTDGTNLLLQVQGAGRVICASPAGELLWIRLDAEMADGGWRACGICRRPGADQVVALYTRDDHVFLARTYNLDLTEVVATTGELAWSTFPDGIAPRSLVHDGQRWVVLASHPDGVSGTFALDDAFMPVGAPTELPANVTGIAVADGWFWAAHDDGTVSQLYPVPPMR